MTAADLARQASYFFARTVTKKSHESALRAFSYSACASHRRGRSRYQMTEIRIQESVKAFLANDEM